MYIYIYIYIYICMYVYTYIRIYVWMWVYVYVYVYMYIYIYIYMYMYMYIYMYISLYIACKCSLFHLALGNEDKGVQLVYESTYCLALGVILTEGKIGVSSVSSLRLFLTRVGVCVCIRTYTHTA